MKARYFITVSTISYIFAMYAFFRDLPIVFFINWLILFPAMVGAFYLQEKEGKKNESPTPTHQPVQNQTAKAGNATKRD